MGGLPNFSSVSKRASTFLCSCSSIISRAYAKAMSAFISVMRDRANA